MTKKNLPSVLFATAELTPIAKVGGLADVAGALPKALNKLGVDVRIAIPKYGIVDEKKHPLKKVAENVAVPFNGNNEIVTIYETPLPGSDVPVYLIDHKKYLGENGVYFEADASSGGSDREAERFTFFARSCLSVIEALDWYPDILHCQDWHAGMIPVIVKILSKNNAKLSHIKTMLTLHNLEYQGWYKTETIFEALGIKEEDYPTLNQQRDGQISSLQQAILAVDYINTVSPTYSQEILTKEYGAGLEESLIKRKGDLVGILNGIDVERFNPEADKHIVKNFSANDPSGKAECKADLQKLCGLKVDNNIPVLGIVSRLAGQKGLDLIAGVGNELAEENMQFILLGTGSPDIEKSMREMAAAHPDKMYAKIEFNAELAQKIYAGSDMFLMPSRFEPCGLGQLISLRYGTIPVVRATGGLKDTITDYTSNNESGNGFVFNSYDPDAFFEAVKRALELYHNDKEAWAKLVTSALNYDSSWVASAEKYVQLYQKLIS